MHRLEIRFIAATAAALLIVGLTCL